MPLQMVIAACLYQKKTVGIGSLLRWTEMYYLVYLSSTSYGVYLMAMAGVNQVILQFSSLLNAYLELIQFAFERERE